MPSSMIRKLNGLLRTENLGKVIRFFDEIGSTNTALYELASNGASEGTTVIADMQTSGKGRLDRTWVSPPGQNLYISVLFRPSITAGESTLLTFLASIALYECLKKTGIQGASIKWPNDLQIDRRKIAGVLTEMKPKGDMVDFVVVGIGVNINMSRASIKNEMRGFAGSVTSVMENLGREVDRAKFTADLLYELEELYRILGRRGQSIILNEWTRRWGGRDEKVRVSAGENDAFEATAVGIDESGHLLVQRENGEVTKVVAGDVTII